MSFGKELETELDAGSRLVSWVMHGPVPVMFLLLAFLAGAAALMLTPREEDPQIVVPLADVIVEAPGLTARQVERQIATPLENLLFQIDGVEFVYSMSQPGRVIATVRFFVGEDREDSLVKIYNKMFSNLDVIPESVESWVVKPLEIDDVPIVLATLWSKEPERVGDFELRRIAEEVALRLQAVEKTNRVTVTGGRPRVVRVELDPESLAARRTTPLDLIFALNVSNVELPSGGILRRDERVLIEAGTMIQSAEELRDLVVNVVDGNPVYLKDIGRVIDGPDEAERYTWISFGPASDRPGDAETYPAVTVAVAKRKGSNAVWVAGDVHERLAEMKEEFFPPEVEYQVIRDYGETANEKVNDLVKSLFIAVLIVVAFIGIVMGWRPAIVVGLAVPICYGLTLGFGLLTGYTINRVTLFALILALGLLVDDPITGIDNIDRYMKMGRFRKPRAVVLAIQEVRNALIMSTIAIILSFVPMFFITGMMGPYMGPMAVNVPLAVTMSTLVAFFVTPWMAKFFLKPEGDSSYDVRRTVLYKIYSVLLRPLIKRRAFSWAFLGVIGIVFIISVAMAGFRSVPLKLLPFDNKDEFQVVIDMPEGTTLERAESVAREVAAYLRSVPEVEEIAGFVGTASPMDFNGLVRHYYLREGANVADLRVTLVPRLDRAQQSHEMILRIRNDVEGISRASEAVIKLVEVPPGPPVISTVAVELYGEETTPYETLQEAAFVVAERLAREPYVVDVDTSVEADQSKLIFETDKEKAALSGVATADVAETMKLAVMGRTAAWLEAPRETNPLPVILRLPLERRSSAADLGSLYVKGREGITKVREGAGVREAAQPLVQLAEIGEFRETIQDKTIYHKNLKPVAYVFAEMAGRAPADAVLDVAADLNGEAAERPLERRTYLNPGGGDPWTLPEGVRAKWNGEGEWFITLRVFRDLGIAFGAAMVGIFIVLLMQTRSAVISLIIMLAIPLSMIGIMPGFWLLNQIGRQEIGGFPNPTFFTATAMIGMIALAGIVVRNSLILIEFIHQAIREGLGFQEALVQAGAIRARPIFLTAGTTLLGNIVITLDPIFNGLAWSIIFGITASTVFTLAVIPVVYFLVYERDPKHGVKEG